MRELYELHGRGWSVRRIARELAISRNTVRKYLRSPGLPKEKPRRPRESKLAPYVEYIDGRLSEGLYNCEVLLRELRDRGYAGSVETLRNYVRPRRQRRQPQATSRFETEPGEQAQIDFASMPYIGEDGNRAKLWAFVMVLSWSRSMYVEFVRRCDTATLMRSHVNAFEYFGGVPRRCLYDNTRAVILDRDAAGGRTLNPRMLDLSRRLGFEIKLCRPYRPQTKGKVERSIEYVRNNLWPTLRFTDDADLNRQGIAWCDGVANLRVHGTTGQRPADRLGVERTVLGRLPERSSLAPYLREDRRVSRDGYVKWDGAYYGVPWVWATRTVQVAAGAGTVEIWAGGERIAMHPRAIGRGQRLNVSGQWKGLPTGDSGPTREALAFQVAGVEVERRPLDVYEAVAMGGQR